MTKIADPLVRGMDPDPDPPQNVMDPQHWIRVNTLAYGPERDGMGPQEYWSSMLRVILYMTVA
jgi:hypothetical protein